LQLSYVTLIMLLS